MFPTLKVQAFWALVLIALGTSASEPIALRNAHAHNDYEHPRPLADALAAGFNSVEADLFLMEGELRVAHYARDTKPGRTLRNLYLNPLLDLAKTNDGRIHPKRADFYLMLDYKASGESNVLAMHQAVSRELSAFADLVTSVQDGCVSKRAVTVVLSGSRPAELIKTETTRYWSIDGQIPDLSSTAPAHLIPWISTSWRPTFHWDGTGDFPSEERQRLREIVNNAHRHGRLLRFWGAPDRPEFWQMLREERVDLINTDRLSELAKLLASTGSNGTSGR